MRSREQCGCLPSASYMAHNFASGCPAPAANCCFKLVLVLVPVLLFVMSFWLWLLMMVVDAIAAAPVGQA